MLLNASVQLFIDARGLLLIRRKGMHCAKVYMCLEHNVVFICQLPPKTCRYIQNVLLLKKLFTSLHFTLNAQTVKDVCGYLHVWKTRTTPRRPQSDGQYEKTIRTVVDLLEKYCPEAQDDWGEYLDSIACAYNSTVHESTGFSPYFLQHGREIRLPIDLETGTTQLDLKSNITEFARKLKSKMNDAFAVAQQNLGKAHQIQKSTYDRYAWHCGYQVSDYVLYYDNRARRGRCMKLNSPWTGPG